MDRLTPFQAIGAWIITSAILYLLASLISWDLSMSDWNWFSNILFWGPSTIFLVWTLNDYFISPKK